METFYWLRERLKTYELLLGESEWDKAEYGMRVVTVDLLYATAVSAGEALLEEMIEHYDALKGREDGLQVPVRNGD